MKEEEQVEGFKEVSEMDSFRQGMLMLTFLFRIEKKCVYQQGQSERGVSNKDRRL